MFAEAESTVSRTPVSDDDYQSEKSSYDTDSSLTSEERGYQHGEGKVIDLSAGSFQMDVQVLFGTFE